MKQSSHRIMLKFVKFHLFTQYLARKDKERTITDVDKSITFSVSCIDRDL